MMRDHWRVRMTSAEEQTLAERLEAGELVVWPTCPFTLPTEQDSTFLRSQQSPTAISLDPQSGLLDHPRAASADDAEQLAAILRNFSRSASGWLAHQLPEYAGKWTRDRSSWLSFEEATRPCRHQDRNDLLHIDTSPDRPTNGRRILRLYVNLNQNEPRVWVMSHPFERVLQLARQRQRVPAMNPREWCLPLAGLQRLLQRDWSGRPAYDCFMSRIQQMLRSDEQFQEKAPRRLTSFAPGSAWLLFGDAIAHAELRGQFALEHTFFVPPHALARPELSPLEQLVAAGDRNAVRRAA